jgi:hypothetical protein
MNACIGIRREDKSRWERRVPVTPEDARKLKEEHGIEVWVQPSPIRVFSEEEFTQTGAIVQEDLSPCPVIFAVKEISPDLFEAGKTYVFFTHVIKGQPYNMPMLRKMPEVGPLEKRAVDFRMAAYGLVIAEPCHELLTERLEMAGHIVAVLYFNQRRFVDLTLWKDVITPGVKSAARRGIFGRRDVPRENIPLSHLLLRIRNRDNR